MIRESNLEDLDIIMQTWLESNIEVHSFVPLEYWKKNFDGVKEAIAEGFIVYEKDGKIKGLSSI